MARIKLDLPAELPFQCRLRIRVTDLNYGGHLGNDKVLSLMHEARMQYFQHYGYSETDAEGTSFIMGDCAIVYKSEGFYGQELICEVGALDFSRVAFDIVYRFRFADDGKVLAEAKTGLVCFSYETRKVGPVPAALRERLESSTPISSAQS